MQTKAGVRSEAPVPYGEAVALLPGWYTLDRKAPHLLGTRCKSCGTYYFPKLKTFCRNPACDGETFEEVQLSRTGKLWSCTSASYAPPEPFVAREPFAPFAIAAVELKTEKLIVLGAVVDGVGVSALRAGMTMELALEPLADGKLIYKWRPTPSPGPSGHPLPQGEREILLSPLAGESRRAKRAERGGQGSTG